MHRFYLKWTHFNEVWSEFDLKSSDTFLCYGGERTEKNAMFQPCALSVKNKYAGFFFFAFFWKGKKGGRQNWCESISSSHSSMEKLSTLSFFSVQEMSRLIISSCFISSDKFTLSWGVGKSIGKMLCYSFEVKEILLVYVFKKKTKCWGHLSLRSIKMRPLWPYSLCLSSMI